MVSLALTLGAGCSGSPDDAEGTAGTEDQAVAADGLILEYPARYACEIFINNPQVGPVANQSWRLTGTRISWRYNLDATWAVVSDPKRAGVTYPWWGFTRRDCIDGAPTRILEGRSHVAASGWHSVDYHLKPAPFVATHKPLHVNATLRDGDDFVIGNAPKDWHVDVTGVTRSNGYWVEVYVPNAKQWGYIQASDLR
jgi:hypothetical protein